VPLADLRKQVIKDFDKHMAVVCDYLIFRNDWKNSAQFADLAGVEGTLAALLAPIMHAPSVTLKVSGILKRHIADGAFEGYMVDASVYGNRVFTATSEGLFETEFNPDFPTTSNDTLLITDSSTSSVASKGAKVVFATGDKGLFSRGIEFGHGADWPSASAQEPLELLDDASRRVSFTKYSLLNYTGERVPQLLFGDVDTRPTDRFEETIVTGFRPGRDIASAVDASIGRDASKPGAHKSAVKDSGSTGVTVLGNADYRLLVAHESGHGVVDLATFTSDVEIQADKKFRSHLIKSELLLDALTTQRLQSGFLVEGFDSTLVITEQGTNVLIDEPRVRIRSFPASRRHSDSFVAIGEDFVEIVGFIDDRAADPDF
jgi:hypothetical protein